MPETDAPAAAKKTASTRKTTAKADPTEVFTTALAKPADDPEHQKAVAFLETQVAEAIAKQPADTRPRNIIEALVEVMRRATHVTKDSRNSHGNFNFRGIDAVINALGPAMREVGVVPQSKVLRYHYGDVVVGQNRTQQAHVQVEVAYSFHYSNGDGVISSIEASVPGEAMDSGDKATAKAMSVAMRIALLQTFALPTTEPDPDHYSYERSAAQAPGPTPDDVISNVSWACQQDDLEGAFATVRERFGDHLLNLQVHNRSGELVRADAYVGQCEAMARDLRAKDAAREQDARAVGETRDVNDEQVSAATPALNEMADQYAASLETPTEQPPAAPAEQPAPAAGGDRRMLQVSTELRFQAETLGQSYDAYVAPVTDGAGLLVPVSAQKQAVQQRAGVIEVLRMAGRATEADAYAAVIEVPFIDIDRVINADGARGVAEETARA